MAQMMRTLDTCQKLLLDLTPGETMRLTATCRQIAESRKQFIGSAIFACTRDGPIKYWTIWDRRVASELHALCPNWFRANPEFPLGVWTHVWEACARAAEATGLPARLWAEAMVHRLVHFAEVDSLESKLIVGVLEGNWKKAQQYEGGVFDVSKGMRTTGLEEVAYILASVHATQCEDELCRSFFFTALLLLDSGRFAWLSKCPSFEDEPNNDRCLVILTGDDLLALLDFVSEMLGQPALCGGGSKWLQEISYSAMQRGEYDDYFIPVPYDGEEEFLTSTTDSWLHDSCRVDVLEGHLQSALRYLRGCTGCCGSVLGHRDPLHQRIDQNGMIPVEQTIVHVEPAAHRDETLLTMQADEQFAADVEWRLHSTDTRAELEQQDLSRPEQVYILRYGGGNTEAFRSALLNGPELGPCREALKQNFQHPSGALLVVNPEQLPDVLDQLETKELHPFHVIATESKTYLLDEVLAGMPCRQRSKEKRGKRCTLLVQSTDGVSATGNSVSSTTHAIEEASQDSVPYQVIVERTFLCIAPLPLDAHSVNQSTTEACSRGVNPRRLQYHWE